MQATVFESTQCSLSSMGIPNQVCTAAFMWQQDSLLVVVFYSQWHYPHKVHTQKRQFHKLWIPDALCKHSLLIAALLIIPPNSRSTGLQVNKGTHETKRSYSEEQWRHRANFISTAMLRNLVMTLMALTPNDNLLLRVLWILIPWSKRNI